MIPKQAIEKAIEGGWKNSENIYPHWSVIAFDKTFWQALGKALGWEELDWIPYGQHFAKVILTGGDTEAFWKEILK